MTPYSSSSSSVVYTVGEGKIKSVDEGVQVKVPLAFSIEFI